jgi:hypothetical protein
MIGYEWAIGEDMGGSGHNQPCLEELNKTTKASFKAGYVSQDSRLIYESRGLFGLCGCNLQMSGT